MLLRVLTVNPMHICHSTNVNAMAQSEVAVSYVWFLLYRSLSSVSISSLFLFISFSPYPSFFLCDCFPSLVFYLVHLISLLSLSLFFFLHFSVSLSLSLLFLPRLSLSLCPFCCSPYPLFICPCFLPFSFLHRSPAFFPLSMRSQIDHSKLPSYHSLSQ